MMEQIYYEIGNCDHAVSILMHTRGLLMLLSLPNIAEQTWFGVAYQIIKSINIIFEQNVAILLPFLVVADKL
jgi:hypothetical protein